MVQHPSRPKPGSILATEGPITVEKAPFDHIEVGARLVIVGITPGAQQRDLAYQALQNAQARGLAASEAERLAKFAASFGGAMRNNLVKMLDSVGADKWLGLPSFARAFDPATRGKVHFTSALRNPVFFNGANYNGQIGMLSSPALITMIETLLAEEVRALPNAVWQPLGERPLQALEHLAAKGVLSRSQIAPALPHPSGANAERISCFLGNKNAADLSSKTNGPKILALRQSLERFYKARQEAA